MSESRMSVDEAMQLALARQHAGRLEEAAAIFQQIYQALPGHHDALHMGGVVAFQRGDLIAAGNLIRRSLALKPDNAAALNNLGKTLLRQGDLADAAAAFRRALVLQPDSTLLLSNLGQTLIQQQAFVEAEQVMRRAIQLHADDPAVFSGLVSSLLLQGRQSEAGTLAREAMRRFQDAVFVQSPLLAALLCDTSCSPEEYLAAARQFGAAATARARPFTRWRVEALGTDVACLRVGLVSGDLRLHPVGFFLENFIAHIDSSRVQFVAYKTLPQEDALTARLRRHIGEWHDISGLVDERAAAKIHDDGIHVLVDLAGHTAWNRLPLFAWKPAPVQVSWLGYSASTGLPAVDWLIADAMSVPVTEQHLYSERCWYMPESRICFTPPEDAPPVAPLPAQSGNGVTFGCFHNMTKVGDPVLALWARVLDAVPGARLRVQNREMSLPEGREELLRRFERLGIARERVLTAGAQARVDYLAAHAEVDIILDTFPYNGGTTTCEGLWMGVPTVSRAGRTMLSRYGATVLHSVGLDDWVAESDDEYLRKAVAHASDILPLARLRAGLRERMRVSALCDGPGFARRFADAMHGMWRANPPASR